MPQPTARPVAFGRVCLVCFQLDSRFAPGPVERLRDLPTGTNAVLLGRFTALSPIWKSHAAGLTLHDSTPCEVRQMIGKTVGHFLITSKLGAGGMGEVFLAEDTRLERKAAIKFLPAEYAADPGRDSDSSSRPKPLRRSITHMSAPSMTWVRRKMGCRISRWNSWRANRSMCCCNKGLRNLPRRRDRRSSGRRVRCRSCQPHRASRHQAGQHQSQRAGPREGPRLRPGQANAPLSRRCAG